MSALELRGEPAAIWERQKGETVGSYAAFVVYRDQTPPRSIARLAKALGRGQRVLNGWSTKYDWVRRANAWTDHLDALSRQAVEDDIVRLRREENERLFELGRRVRGKGEEALDMTPPGLIAAEPADTIRYIESGTKLMRLALGLPTDLTGTMSIKVTDFQKVIGTFIEIAAKHMTPETHEAFVRECHAMIRESLGG